MHYTTLHSTQNTSLVSSIVLFLRSAENASFLLKVSFAIAILSYFLTAVQIATDNAHQVFEAFPLFDVFIFNSYVYLVWFSSENHDLRLTYIYLHPYYPYLHGRLAR